MSFSWRSWLLRTGLPKVFTSLAPFLLSCPHQPVTERVAVFNTVGRHGDWPMCCNCTLLHSMYEAAVAWPRHVTERRCDATRRDVTDVRQPATHNLTGCGAWEHPRTMIHITCDMFDIFRISYRNDKKLLRRYIQNTSQTSIHKSDIYIYYVTMYIIYINKSYIIKHHVDTMLQLFY